MQEVIHLCHITLFFFNFFFVFRQYQDFLEDLEEDEALRKNVNIFRGKQEDIYTALTDFRPSEQFFCSCLCQDQP